MNNILISILSFTSAD